MPPSRLGRRDLLLGLGAGLVSSCAPVPRKSLAQLRQLYAMESQRVRDRLKTMIAVPGIMGSELRRSATHETVWGRWRLDLTRAGRRLDDRDIPVIALPMRRGAPLSSLVDDLEPAGILHYVELDLPTGPLWVNAYAGAFAGLLRQVVDLKDMRPVVLAHDEFKTPPFIGHGYDWRRDISEQAVRLGAVIEAAAKLRGGPVPVLGHSMGCLVLRYYLRYGPRPLPEDGSIPPLTWEGARNVRTAILAGPPNAGSVAVLSGLIQGKTVDALLPVYPAAALATMPASFQLMPRVRHAAVRWSDTKEPVDLYDVATWQRLRWGPFSPGADADLRLLLPEVPTAAQREEVAVDHVAKCLARATQLHRALDAPAEPPASLRLHCVIGDALDTAALYEVDRSTGKVKVAARGPGDGTVTRASALLDERVGGHGAGHPFDSPFEPTDVRFVDYPHENLLDTPAVLDELLFEALR